MKNQQILLTTSILALADLSRFRLVGIDGGVCVAGAKALGPCEATTSAGEQAPVNMTGALLVEAGGPITAGVEVESDGAGRVITKTTGISNGWAMDAAAAAGDVIRVARGI